MGGGMDGREKGKEKEKQYILFFSIFLSSFFFPSMSKIEEKQFFLYPAHENPMPTQYKLCRVINLNNLTFPSQLLPGVSPSEVGKGRILPAGRAQQALSKVLAQLPTSSIP